MGRGINSQRRSATPFSKVAQFVKGKFVKGKFSYKLVRNAGFAGKHAKIHLSTQDEEPQARLQYWTTDVATLSGNVVKLDMGGWRTRSTAEAMNIFLQLSGSTARVCRKNWKYLLVGGQGRKIASFGREGDCEGTPVVHFNVKTNKLVKK